MSRRLALLGTLAVAGCDPGPAPEDIETPAECSNGEVVTRFYEQALVRREVRAGFEAHMSADFVEHKPDVPTGDREGTIRALEGLIAEFPEAKWEVIRVVAEGDLVAIHARATLAPGMDPYAVADFFRVENCRIVEHWDVVAGPVEGARNPHSRF